jgi:hypothetical protein
MDGRRVIRRRAEERKGLQAPSSPLPSVTEATFFYPPTLLF